jgi:hypothetical protein
MRCAHEYDTLDAIEYAAEMGFRIVSREQNSLLADKAAKAVGDEDEGTR